MLRHGSNLRRPGPWPLVLRPAPAQVWRRCCSGVAGLQVTEAGHGAGGTLEVWAVTDHPAAGVRPEGLQVLNGPGSGRRLEVAFLVLVRAVQPADLPVGQPGDPSDSLHLSHVPDSPISDIGDGSHDRLISSSPARPSHFTSSVAR